MAGTRSSPRADGRGESALVRAVDRSLAEHVTAGARIAVALSGGRDSVALLAAVIECGRVEPADIVAIHVHHGISAQADAWAVFCTRLAASHGIALVTQRVGIDPHDADGLEAAARSARYDALRSAAREAGATAVLLAHHQDDQAETMLLQLLRGAGVHGLAAMPVARTDDGLCWLRPLLDIPRRDLEAFVRARKLAYVDDDSNAADRHRRNALRQRVVPAILSVADGYPATIARAAAHQAEAARLIDDLAALDAAPLLDNGTLDRAGLAALAPHRARNVLRYFLRHHGLRPPSTARLHAMLSQLGTARPDARIRFAHEGIWFGVFRGRLVAHPATPPMYERAWQGEAFLDLPHGRLAFITTRGSGLSATCLDDGVLIVRPRAGGERLQPFVARPRRALKAWLQEASMPRWQREALPLLFCGDALAAVPGLGVDVAFQAGVGEEGFTLDWQPAR
jgi:tRNA(Ile)-lysidine synthase